MGKDLAGDAADGGSDGDDSEQGGGEGTGRSSGLSQEMPPAAVRFDSCVAVAAMQHADCADSLSHSNGCV